MPRFTPRVLAVAWALLAFWARGASAETAVGIEARGMDPMVALQNSQGLDLRDELGRPVSPKLIAAQLKAVQATVASEVAFASRLPAAQAMAKALEFWRVSAAAFASDPSRLPWRELWALPAPKPGFRAGVALVLLAACTISCCPIRCGRSRLAGPSSGACVALRC